MYWNNSKSVCVRVAVLADRQCRKPHALRLYTDTKSNLMRLMTIIEQRSNDFFCCCAQCFSPLRWDTGNTRTRLWDENGTSFTVHSRQNKPYTGKIEKKNRTVKCRPVHVFCCIQRPLVLSIRNCVTGPTPSEKEKKSQILSMHSHRSQAKNKRSNTEQKALQRKQVHCSSTVYCC